MNTAIAPAVSGAWKYKQLFVALGFAFILQSLFLPCLCSIGIAKMVFAFSFDGLVLLRMGIAYRRREAGGGWKFYAWLICTSPIWIEGVTNLAFGDT